jgi:arsenate reductase
VFGANKSAETRKALRFFSERRIRTHFVDFAVRPPSSGELRRFVQKFGVEALLDRTSRRFAELGLSGVVLSGEGWIQKLTEEPLLLKVPLVRNGKHLTIGMAEETWKAWIA